MTKTDEAQKHIIAPENALDFILAGNALFTVRNTKTKGRYTFKICQGKPRGDSPAPHFVKVRASDKDEGQYTYVGAIFDRQTFRLTRASRVTRESLAYRAFRWVFYQLQAGTFPDTVEIWHEGRCGRCGLVLTVPESIETGLGPVCASKVKQAKAPDRFDLTETPRGLAVIAFYRMDGRDFPPEPGQILQTGLADYVAELEANDYTIRQWPGGARAWKGTPWPIRTVGKIRKRRDEVTKLAERGHLAAGFFWGGLDFALDC